MFIEQCFISEEMHNYVIFCMHVCWLVFTVGQDVL